MFCYMIYVGAIKQKFAKVGRPKVLRVRWAEVKLAIFHLDLNDSRWD